MFSLLCLGRERNVLVNNDHRLLNHGMYSIEVNRVARCIRACFKDKTCRSVNLLPNQSGFVCELNNSTQFESDTTDYVQSDGITYAEYE